MPAPIHFFDKPKPARSTAFGGFELPEEQGCIRIARPKPKKTDIVRPAAKDIPPLGIALVPGVVVPEFYIDPKTKIFGCFTRPWENILVEELETKMKASPKGAVDVQDGNWMAAFKTALEQMSARGADMSGSRLLMDSIHHYSKQDATLTRHAWEQMKQYADRLSFVPTLPQSYSPRPSRMQGVPPDVVVTSEIDYAALEMRILARMNEAELKQVGLDTYNFTVHKHRDTCRPTSIQPAPQLPIFRPSQPTSAASAEKDSVIPRLLADSVSKKKHWPGV